MVGTETDLGQKTLTESGTPVEERLPDVGRLKALAALLIRNDEKRNRADRRIKGMVDGNPPYNTSRLKRAAQLNRCNINWMEGKAQHSAAMVPYYDLLRGSARMVSVQLENDDPYLRNYWSDIVSEEFDYVLKEWPGFMYQLDLLMWDRLRYGKGFLMWPNDSDPEFHWVNRFNVHVPDTTRANVEELEVLIIEEDMPVDKVWQYSKEPRWNRAACLEAIKKSEPNSLPQIHEARSDLTQAKLNDKDMLDGISANAVKVAHVFQKEFNGKISHYIVETTGASRYEDLNNTARAQEAALYEAHEAYEDWKQCFWVTFHENADGSWNGASGLGKDIVQQIEVKNRLLCSTFDNANLRSALTLQASTAADWATGAALKNMGSLMVIPPGHTAINTATFVGDLDGLVVANKLIEETLTRNTGIYRPLPEKAEGNPPTATETMWRAQQSTVLNNSAVVRFYSDLDCLYSEVYRRLTQPEPKTVRSRMKKMFVERIEKRGLRMDDLRKVEFVRAYRNIGNGSNVMRQQALMNLSAVASMFPESGRQSWLRDTVVSQTSVEAADRYVPPTPQDPLRLDAKIAILENGQLIQGQQIPIGDDENDVIHAQTHLQAAAQGLASVQQGADPAQVLAANDSLMPHAGAHIQRLEGNPGRKNEAKLLRQQWTQIAKANDQLRESAQEILEQRQKIAEAEQQAQAIREGQDPKVMIEAARTERELAMAEQRNAQAMEGHGRKAQQELAIADARAASEIQIQTAKAMSEIETMKAKLAADMQSMQAKAAKEAESVQSKASEAQASGQLPAINIELMQNGEKKGQPKSISFERDAKGKIKSASVKIEVDGDGGKQTESKTVSFSRDGDGRIASAAVKTQSTDKGE